jgi:hypothetical protein
MSTITKDNNGQLAQCFGFGTTQTVAIGSGSVQSTAVASETKVLRLVATTECHLAIGSNPTASQTTSFYMPANTIEYVRCGGSDKVAVIQKSGGSTGSLFVTETV